MVRSEGDRLCRVIVSPPRVEYFRVNELEDHNIGEIADQARAIAQHERLCSLLQKFGARVIRLKELAGHPNSVFTRDTSLITPRGYIKLRMGLPSRRGEEEWMGKALESSGLPCVGTIRPPATVEGGDVVLAGDVAFVGQSERTNGQGARQISRLLHAMGYEVRTLLLPPPHLHIGGAMSLVSPDTILCCSGVFPRGFFSGFKTISIPCQRSGSGNVICLGEKEVIVEKRNAVASRALDKAGFRVHSLDLSEFLKGRGGPTCLILPVERKSGGPDQKEEGKGRKKRTDG